MIINSISNYKYNYKIKENKSKHNDLLLTDEKEYIPISYPAEYYIKNLSFKGDDFKTRLKHQLNKANEEELFLFLDEELRQKAVKQKIPIPLIDDLVQDTIMDIYILVHPENEKPKPKDVLVENINEIYEKLNERKKTYPNEFGIKSIYEEIGYDEDFHHLSLIDILPDDEDHRIIPLSPPSEETIQKRKDEVETVLNNSDLDERSQSLLKDKFIKRIPNKDLTQNFGLCEQTVILLIKRAKIKAQIANNALPQKTKQQIKEISEIFNTDYNTAQNMVINNPYLLNHTNEDIQKKINGMVSAFSDNGLTDEKYKNCCIRHSQLLNKGTKALEKNVKEVSNHLQKYGINLNDYIKSCIKQPSLFYNTPENIESNITAATEKFKNNGLTADKYIKACIKYPPLFCSSPETIEKYIHGTVEEFSPNGLTVDKYIKAACKVPSLFITPPQTVKKNITGTVNRFKGNNLTIDKYIKAACKTPTLFYQSPDTIENNIKGTVKKFEKEGLSTDNYIKSACIAPSLFVITPDRIENNVRTFVKEYQKYGLTTEQYIKACNKRPYLYYSSFETLKNHINSIVNTFKDEGLTEELYLKCCIKQPPLLGLKEDTIKNNVLRLVNTYKDKGLKLNDYIKTCIQAPSLFQSHPETIAEHINIKMFSMFNTEKNNNEKEMMKKTISNGIELSFSSKLLLIKNLILPKMFESSRIPSVFLRGGHLEEKLQNYLKENPEKTYDINVKNYQTDTDCIQILGKCLQEISQKALGKDNIFKLNIN